MEPTGSLLCSQQPATGPYSEPDESSPYFPILFPQGSFQCYPLIYAYILHVASSL